MFGSRYVWLKKRPAYAIIVLQSVSGRVLCSNTLSIQVARKRGGSPERQMFFTNFHPDDRQGVINIMALKRLLIITCLFFLFPFVSISTALHGIYVYIRAQTDPNSSQS